jgi:hypothetical protein
MLVVLSLGTDIGVFAASLQAKRADLSFETRLTLMKLVGRLDLFPRISFALFLPVGLHLAQGLGLYPVTPGILATSWLIVIFWIALIVVVYNNEGTRLAITLIGVQTVLQLAVGGVFVTIGAKSLITGAPLDQGWFALKMLLFGLMFWTAMVVEVIYRPLFDPFLEIGRSGSTPEREARVTKYFHRSLIGVFVIYLQVAGMAFLGATKPFF